MDNTKVLELIKKYSCRSYKPNIDFAIAVEHLCLAATEQGLDTCWVCNFDTKLYKKSFGLGENEGTAVLTPIDYPADDLKEKKRKDIAEIVKKRIAE